MDVLFNTAVFIQAAIYIGVAFAVLIRNPKKPVNLTFFTLGLLSSIWIVASYFGGTTKNTDLSEALIRIDYLTGLLLIGAFWFFARALETEFEPGKHLLKPGNLLVLLVVVLGSFSTLSPEVLQISSIQSADVTAQPLYYVLYLLPSIALMISSIYNLWRLKSRGNAKAKAMVNIIMLSFLAPAILVGVPFLIFDVIFHASSELRLAQRLGTLGFTIFILGTSYAVIRHKLFDMKRFFAQSTAYLMVVGVLSLGYALSISTVTRVAFPESPLSAAQQAIYILIAVILAYTIQPLRRVFDKFTKAVFFHDAYDSQDVLDRLSSLLATEIDLNIIAQESSTIVSDALKPLHLRFMVFKDGETHLDIALNDAPKKRAERKTFQEFESVLVQKDEVNSKDLKAVLDRYDADILIKLRTNEETVGAILLGPKQSGTVYSKQDIDLLTISEKELAIAVQNARYFEQIQEFNIKLQEEIKQATAELRASNTKLKELDEAKDEFISMASHQLRTPLTSVKGYISMVIEGDTGKIKPEQKKLLSEAFASSQRMVYLIADLLNVSRLKTGKFVIEPAEVNLAELVEQELSQLKATARSRKLKLKYDKPSRFPKVWLDETKIRQVIMNFVDNAIYYTPAGGEINVIVTAKKDTVEFKVKDDGIGVPKEEQAKLFAKFYRAGNAKRARPDGTGLGLYMAQRVVSAQGGSIIFESKEGQGSTFGFSFPLSSVKTKQALLNQGAEEPGPPEPNG